MNNNSKFLMDVSEEVKQRKHIREVIKDMIKNKELEINLDITEEAERVDLSISVLLDGEKLSSQTINLQGNGWK